MSHLELEAFLPYRLVRISAALSKRARAAYRRKYALTIAEWRVLASLGQFERMTATEMVRHSGMHKTMVSRAIAGLEKRHWLKREINAKDRREEVLSLGTEGRRVYASIVPDMQKFENEILNRLGPGPSKALLAALDALEHNLRTKKDAP